MESGVVRCAIFFKSAEIARGATTWMDHSSQLIALNRHWGGVELAGLSFSFVTENGKCKTIGTKSGRICDLRMMGIRITHPKN
jgi:hypothetical protein